MLLLIIKTFRTHMTGKSLLTYVLHIHFVHYVPRTLRALVSYVPRTLSVLVLHVPCLLRAPLPGAIRSLVPDVPGALRALVPNMSHGPLGFVSHAFRALRAPVPHVYYVLLLYLMILVPYVFSGCSCLATCVLFCFKPNRLIYVSCLVAFMSCGSCAFGA